MIKKKITRKEQDKIDKDTINKHKIVQEKDLEDGDLNDLFNSEVQGERDIVKELFDHNNVDTKTEVTDFEIAGLSKLSFYAHYIGFDELNQLIERFLRLKISRKRKSRDEFVKALGRIENSNQPNFMGLMGKQ